MYLNHIKIKKNITLFKKRKLPITQWNENNFIFLKSLSRFNKKTIIFSKNLILLELKLYKFFFLNLRKLSRRKKFFSFVYLYCNHCFSKKSKNSRMGKGKGKFLRFVCRKKNLQPLFMFSKISNIRIQKFLKFLKKKTQNKFFLFRC